MKTIKEEDQMNFADLGIWSGKTSPEHLAAKKAQTSRQSSKKSSASSSRKPPMCLCLKKDGQQPDASTMKWEDGALLGAYTTHSFGESPSVDAGSRLSQILEVCPHQKYYLSAKACEGILRRAERRGKELPPMLKEALVAQSVFKNAEENRGGGKGILIQNERTGALSTLNNQSVFNIGSYHSNAWKSDNPHSGVYETEVSKTLDALNCGYPACNQGGTAVVCMATQQGGAEVRADDRAREGAGAGGDGRLDAVSGGFCHESAKARSIGWGEELAPTLTAGVAPGVVSAVTLEPGIAAREGGHIYEGVCGTLRAEAGDNCMAVAYTMAVYNANGNGDGETVCTITGDHENRVTDYTALLTMQGFGDYRETGVASACKSRDYKDATDLVVSGIDARNGAENGDLCGTLQAKPNGGFSYNCIHPVRINKSVRRLTPLECERLQGYPSEKKVDVSKMTKDEYIAWNLAEKNIIADPEKGIVYATRGPGGILYDEPKELKGTELNGYKVVSIRNGGTKLQCRVHRIIWISQNGIIPEGYCIDHINNDKQDNRISNLQLLTPQENSHKAKEDGLYLEGLDNKVTKLDPDLKDELCYLYHVSDLTQRELAEIYGISKSRVNQIIKEIGWTDIGEWIDSKGKRHESSDSARYKALGNSIALPFWHWLMRRISAQYVGNPTLGSLFDGISGFCLSWARCNGAKNCRWSSEIEEFPMAVTRKHFGDEKTGEVGDIEKYL